MAYISTEEVKAIRIALKAKYGKRFKFSVRRRDARAVAVTIVKGDVDFSDILEGRETLDVNHYYVTDAKYGQHAALFGEIIKIMKTAPGTVEGGREYYNKSDIQTDYFDYAYHMDLQVGDYQKPYEYVA